MPSGVAVYRVEHDGCDFIFKDLNKAGERIEGVAKSELIGRNVREARPGVVELGLYDVFQRVYRTGIPEFHPTSYYHDQKFTRWYENYVYRLSNGDVIAVFDNVTERKQSELAIKNSETAYRTLAENLPGIVYRVTLTDEPGMIFFNEQLLKMTGYSPAELKHGKVCSIDPLIHPDDRESVIEEVGEAVNLKSQFQIEYRLIRKDGEIRQMLERGSVVCGESGEPVCIDGIIFDVTERKKMEEQQKKLLERIQQAQKMESLGVLAGGIAHDFNNLLMVILGNVSVTITDISQVSPIRGSLVEIEKAAFRAADLCKQMLAYSGKGRLVIEVIDLSELVQEMTHMLEVTISKKVVMRYNYFPNLKSIRGDATQIRQVVLNLVINASEAIGQNSGVISVSTGILECEDKYLKDSYLDDALPGGEYVFLEISDTGCGMKREVIDKLFDPFFTTKFTGRGLGLAAALGIIRGHKGAIKVYSEEGRGTTFKILFPALNLPADKTSQAPEDKVSWKGTGTILFADDEEPIRDLVKKTLEKAGFNVLVACDGLKALEIYREKHAEITCVIMDLTMPHIDGEEAFREMQRINPDVKVILSSGFNEQDVTQRLAGKGLTDFIQKPYRPHDLILRLKALLNKGDTCKT